MNNAELIKAVRETDFGYVCEHCEHEDMCRNNDCVIIQAADALEAAEKRIAELLPKEGEWIWEDSVCSPRTCSVCKQKFYIGRGWNYCPNCGARMKTVTDCHTLEEGER